MNTIAIAFAGTLVAVIIICLIIDIYKIIKEYNHENVSKRKDKNKSIAKMD